MPRRADIRKILLLGSGPIVIGQACEFDYSGTQACKVLMEEGFEVVLVNSNPATIMTDPSFSHRTYIEPLVPEVVAKIIEVERPDALLPTLGGQTALNLAVALSEDGTLEKYGVELIGADYAAIHRAEARDEFRATMASINLRVPESAVVKSVREARAALENGLHLPLIIRPSFTLGGHGGGVAATEQEFDSVVQAGLDASPTHQVLLEESVIGWKEFELEVMRDLKDNVVIVCSIENIDPMGVHTGDSITVAPQQTLTDVQYQRLRDASLAIIRAIGVETGGSNIQFAFSPETDELVVIEMNPRVSRSSALASKATGFPIAKIAAKLAVGYTLDEIANDITRKTPACFEPTIDYVVVKTPRWAFEKFPMADARLTTHMKSVGENMAIGRTFKEAFQKSMRSRELDVRPDIPDDNEALVAMIAIPSAERYDLILEAYRRGVTLEALFAATLIDEWFLEEFREIVEAENHLKSFAKKGGLPDLPREELWHAKRLGFSDEYIGRFLGATEMEVRERRIAEGIIPTYKAVDTCAAEFEAYTPYFYSTYEEENEALPVPGKESVIILGSGPNRIGQGIEFDYCCVHAVQEMRELGYQAIMVNCNPETVSTDYDTSDRLYFEPLTFEDVLNIIENEKPKGVVVQFGGQTPLKIAERLHGAGVPILGTSRDAIDLAEDRERFGEVLSRLNLKAPPFGTVRNEREALAVAARIGYPVLVRPSYVLGGRAMEIVYDEETLQRYLRTAVKASPRHPVLIDRFLEHSTEIDVDAICDGEDVYIGAVMQHVEEAGIHSGDSACVIPTVSLGDAAVRRIEEQTAALARELGVVGLMNVQYAVQQSDHGGASIYVLEVNPRGSRTVPFVSKATGVSLARVATRVIAGQKLRDLGLPGWDESVAAGRVPSRRDLEHVAVKEAVLPFPRFPGVDTTLGPEMKSTGEVMGVGINFPEAFAKASLAAGDRLPREGSIFISVADAEKDTVVLMALMLSTLGFRILATEGTHRALVLNGIDSEPVLKHTVGLQMRADMEAAWAASGSTEGQAPITTIVDLIEAGEIDMVINIPRGRGARSDGYEIRRAALRQGVPAMTNAAAAHAAVQAIANDHKRREISVVCLQDLHARLAATANGSSSKAGGGGVTAASVPTWETADGLTATRSLARVAANRALGSLVWLTLEITGWHGARPGQFALLQAQDSRCFLGRPLSIAWEEEGSVSFLVAPVGGGTRELCALRPGESVWVLGPLGNGFDLEALTAGAARVVIVAGGVGAAPFPLLLRRLGAVDAGDPSAVRAAAKPLEVLILLGFRDDAQAEGRWPLLDAAADAEKGRSVACIAKIVTEDGSLGGAEKVTDALRRELRPGDRLAVCGPWAMSEAVARIISAVPDVKAWFSLEAGMACGVGSCHGCVVPLADGTTARVCREGPVFPSQALFRSDAGPAGGASKA